MDTTRLKRSSRPRPKSVNLLQSSSFQGSIPSSAQTPQESRNPRRRHGEFEWQLALLERSTDVTPMESKARPLAPLHDNEPEPVSLPKDNPAPRSKLSHARSGDFVWQLALLQDEGTGIATGKKIETTTTQPNLVGNTLRSAGLHRSRGDLDLKSKVDFQEAKSQASAGSDKKLARPGILGKQDRLSPLPDKSPVKSSAHQGRDQEYVWQLALHRAELAWATQPSPFPENCHNQKGKAVTEEISAALAHHLSGNQAWLVSLEHQFQDGSYGSGSPIPEHRQDRKAQAVTAEITAALGRHLSGNQAWLVGLEHRFEDGSDGAGSLKRDLQNGVWEYPEFERFQASLFHEQSQPHTSDGDKPSSYIVPKADHWPEKKLLRRRVSEDVDMLSSSSSHPRPPETMTKIDERPTSIASPQLEHLQPRDLRQPRKLTKREERPTSIASSQLEHLQPRDLRQPRKLTKRDERPTSIASSQSEHLQPRHLRQPKKLTKREERPTSIASSQLEHLQPRDLRPPETLTTIEERPISILSPQLADLAELKFVWRRGGGTVYVSGQTQTELFECGVCGEYRDVTEKLTLADCVHFFCKECLTTFARTKIDEAQYPIPCPGCLAEKRNDNFLTQDVINNLTLGSGKRQRLDELQLAAHSVTIKCPRCKESMNVDREQYLAKTIIICPAPRCGHRWCKTCLKTFATRGSAEKHRCKAPGDFDELMQKEGWKYCPGCRTPVQRSSGCRHMTCITPGCRVHFCYDCGGLFMDATPGGDITAAIARHKCSPRQKKSSSCTIQ